MKIVRHSLYSNEEPRPSFSLQQRQTVSMPWLMRGSDQQIVWQSRVWVSTEPAGFFPASPAPPPGGLGVQLHQICANLTISFTSKISLGYPSSAALIIARPTS